MNFALSVLSAWKTFLTTTGLPHFTSSLLKYLSLQKVLSDHHLSHSFSPYLIYFSSEPFFFSLYDICVFVNYWSLPPNESFRSSGLGLLGSAHPCSILSMTGHTVSSKLLWKETYRIPKDTKNLSSTSRKWHSPSSCNPSGRTRGCHWVSTGIGSEGCCSLSPGAFRRRGARDHMPALIPSLWSLGHWDPIIFLFHMDSKQLTLAQKALASVL